MLAAAASFIQSLQASVCADKKKKQQHQAWSRVLGVVALVLLVLAVVVALRSTKYANANERLWTVVLAVLFPDLFLIMHGVNAGRHSVPYFAEGPPRMAASGRQAAGMASVLSAKKVRK